MKGTETRLDTLIDNLNTLICEDDLLTRQERSTEVHARFMIAQSVQREAALTGADRYRRELSARLRQLLPLINEAASRPGPNYQPPMDAAALAERLGWERVRLDKRNVSIA